MGAGSHVADVMRTVVVSATVAFLGYLSYTLIQRRLENPPARPVVIDEDTLASLRTEIDEVRSDHAGVLREIKEVELRNAVTDVHGLPANTRIEYGTFAVTFTEQDIKPGETKRKPKWFYAHDIEFENQYIYPPIVLVSDDSVTGAWPHVAVKRITKTGARIKLNAHHGSPGKTATIAYFVIGQVE